MTTVNPAEDQDTKPTQGHDTRLWLTIRRVDSIVKYFEFTALVLALVFDQLTSSVVWFEEKHLWWMIGIALLLNFSMQSIHICLYYVANRYVKEKYYWPRVFPKEWVEGDHGTGYSQHYKFFYGLKALLLSYIGFMVFQERLDGFFVYWVYGLSVVLVVFDLCFYLFNLN